MCDVMCAHCLLHARLPFLFFVFCSRPSSPLYNEQAKTLGNADLINTSLALFIRDLFAVVHHTHAARLCATYIRALRSKEDTPFEVRNGDMHGGVDQALDGSGSARVVSGGGKEGERGGGRGGRISVRCLQVLCEVCLERGAYTAGPV